MNLVYVGPSPGVTIAVDGFSVGCEHGVPFDVPDEIAESLLEQDTFERVPAKKNHADPAATTGSAAVPQEG